MPSLKLGKVSLNPRGAYDPEASYERLDLVQYRGSGYVALRSAGGVAPEDGADWMLLSLHGEDGADGEKGFGYFATAQTLREEHPSAAPGNWAIVGETGGMWIWDGAWKAAGGAVEMEAISADEVLSLWGSTEGGGGSGGGSGGVSDHRLLTGRDAADQHPVEAISGLEELAEEKIREIWNGGN